MPWYLRLWRWVGNGLARRHAAAHTAAVLGVLGRNGPALVDMPADAGAAMEEGYRYADVHLDFCAGCGGVVLRMTAVGGPRDGETLRAHVPDNELPMLRAKFAQLEADRCSS